MTKRNLGRDRLFDLHFQVGPSQRTVRTGPTEESSLLAQAQAHILQPRSDLLRDVIAPSERGLPTLIPEKEQKMPQRPI